MGQDPLKAPVLKDVRVHPTAMIEEGVKIGPSSSVWDHAHIRKNAVLGHHCSVGGKTYIAYEVRIGDYVKLNANVYIPAGVTVEDKVMIAAGTIFINDKYPRAFDYRKNELMGSDPNEETLGSTVREGATVGAACVVLGGLTIGRFALVGAGSVVTRDVPDHALVVGNPARRIGWVCRCGHRLTFAKSRSVCKHCGDRYLMTKGVPSLH